MHCGLEGVGPLLRPHEVEAGEDCPSGAHARQLVDDPSSHRVVLVLVRGVVAPPAGERVKDEVVGGVVVVLAVVEGFELCEAPAVDSGGC